MPYQQSITYPSGTTGNQPSINLDHSIVPFNASVAVIVGSDATAAAQLQVTYDNFDGPQMTDALANWVNVGSSITSTTVTALTAPITRLRLNITSLSGGTLTLTTVQGLSTN
jgi:hypothetical protein